MLVADEDPDVVHGLARIVRSEGYPVDEAVGGCEAVLLARERSPRFVILDYLMHDLGGIEARRQIQEVCPEVRFVITVATENEVEEVQAAGAPVLRKPFEIAKLLAMLEALGEV